MFLIFVKKEIFDNMQNIRFVAGIILCVVMTVASMVILTGQYRNELNDLNRRFYHQDSFLEQYGHLNRAGAFVSPQKPPEVLRPLSVGISWESDTTQFIKNPLPVLFPVVDVVFIIAVIMSLLAILFSYDTVTRERESGTLRLAVSYPVSRATLLSAKWFGGMVTLSIPFVLSLACGMIYIVLHPSIKWSGTEVMTVMLLVFGALTFISVFYLVGMLTSAFTRHSGESILAAFCVWVVFVLVVPNLSPYIAAQLYRIPSVVKINRKISSLGDTERDELGRSLTKEVNKQFLDEYGARFTEYARLRRNELKSRLDNDKELAELHTAYSKARDEAWAEANRIQGEKVEKIREDFEKKANTQTSLAKNIACISPYANFIYVATDLAGTGMRGVDHFGQSEEAFWEVFHEYIMNKYNNASKADPSFDWNSYIDMSDRPRYVFIEESLQGRLDAVLRYWGLLLFFNVLLFAGVFVKFIRYDVR